MENKELKDFERELDDSFKTRHSFAALKRLLDNRPDVEYLGSGSSRLVYKVNEDKVLKIAKNVKGVAQNETEADWGLKNYGVAAEWYDVSDEGIWIESEVCSKVKVTDFKKKLGFTFKYFCDCLRYCHYERNPGKYRYYHVEKPEGYEETYDNDFIRSFYDYIADFGVPVGDLTRISSYGYNHEGNIVLVDTGLSDNVYDEYYKR